jgi:outer membrane immunogenic protein
LSHEKSFYEMSGKVNFRVWRIKPIVVRCGNGQAGTQKEDTAMKLSLPLAALGCALMSATALAADLPARKAAPTPIFTPAPAYSWDGFYLGVQAGGVWDRVSSAGNNSNYYYSLLFPALATVPWYGYNSGASTKSGFVGGGHAGYNWQMGAFVLGAEGDLEGASVWSGSLRGSLRGRLGFAADRVLFYGTGGLAFGGRNGSSTYGAWGYNYGGATSSTRLGWTVGAGVEYLITQNWSAGLEYRYSNFGANNSTGYWGGNLGGNANMTENAIRARVSYHFSAPAAPVLARY